ncbi:NAD(P)/FAD-dependent oxidoreductase [Dyadobacter psychrotolerans]|uniref:NAD(P)/FAD-dependent oxidoreductase n=1 Tax=Dyadobacter psychrotolerans TaxID=2541721 RepID=A0A4R5DEW3_9BACT|nr:NAD(P)/FAD-dependent oxidoreductase [Dyadobacter psychrotolerans]TDE10294.1 NAD(P)/FAD-dependent oxidoreductase [Dyadobacter psychrotolerans]
MQKVDVLVIGAGPAGTVAASYLKNQGYNVTILEKEKFPRFQIGESLLPCCMQHLDESGLLEAVKAKNFQKKTGAAFMRGDKRCEFLFSEQFTDGWTWTWQVKRADFDLTLAEATRAKGVGVNFECEVLNVVAGKEKQTTEYRDIDGNIHSIESRFIIDSSGYGRVLPRLFDLSKPSAFTPRGAVFSHLEDINRTEKTSNNIFVHSFDNNRSWIWAIPFSDGSTSVGIVSDKEKVVELAANGGEKYEKFIRNFGDLNGRFKNSELKFEPRNILGYSVGVKTMFGDGFVLSGNSTEFLDPIFSSGVTFATASGLLSAKMTHRHLQGENVDWKTEYEDVVQKGINVFRSYVTGWYSGDFQTIVFAKNVDKDIKNQICSVLAGYVWDKSNPFVKKHDTILPTLAKVIVMKEKAEEALLK